VLSISSQTGAGRYAPSPSGDLHLGNLRTALLAWLFARSSGRAFVLRIEDLDRDRDHGAAMSQLRDLEEIGVEWDGDAVLQSERVASYEAAISRLRDRELVYECTCSRREILEAPRAPHDPPGAYPGTCRELTEAERQRARERIAPRLPAVRLNVTAWCRSAGISPSIRFHDQFMGDQMGTVDDFVLKRGDGAFAYHLAVVVDDAAIGVDQVVRGDDLAASTPRQIVLQRILDLPTPPDVEYWHVPLVLGPSGKRLAKRDGAVTLRELSREGISAEQVRSQLAASLNLAAENERVSPDALLRRFDPEVLPRAPWTWRP